MKNLDSIKKLSENQLCGNESFCYKGQETDMTILEFWRWHFSDIYDMHDKFAEFIVAKALELTQADNTGAWTLYDISYRGKRIEIKESSYFHSWQTDDEPKNQVRVFGITKAYSEYKDSKSTFERQNDIYVFCLNTGETRATSNPLNLENWEFYIVPTSVINEKCGDGKRISIGKLRRFAEAKRYDEIKDTIDSIIDTQLL